MPSMMFAQIHLHTNRGTDVAMASDNLEHRRMAVQNVCVSL